MGHTGDRWCSLWSHSSHLHSEILMILMILTPVIDHLFKRFNSEEAG